MGLAVPLKRVLFLRGARDHQQWLAGAFLLLLFFYFQKEK
jgi:hypothetical protein